MNADGAGFLGGRGVDTLDEGGIESAADGEAFGKDGRAGEHRAVGSFFIFEGRDFETGLRDGDALEFVEVVRVPRGVGVAKGVGEGKESCTGSDFICVGACYEFARGVDFFVRSFAEVIDVGAREIELADFFHQRHAMDEVVDAGFDGLRGIEVDGLLILVLGEGRDRGCGEQQEEDCPGLSMHDASLPCCAARRHDSVNVMIR